MSSLPVNAFASSTIFLPAGLEQKRAAALKHIVESGRLVAVLPASRLEIRPRPEMLATGISEIDAMTGGIPRGCLSEIYGSASSGKTSVLVATIAAATHRKEACVLIDASDSFDPTSGAKAGMDFQKLLWVRCGDDKHFHKKRAETLVSPNPMFVEERASSPAHKLEQVLKATDFILQSGGFALVTLDLAGISDKFVRRIPLASWFRFQRAVEHTKTALLVITDIPCAQTCATLVVKLRHQSSAISHQPSGNPAHAELMQGMRIEAEIVRSRLERKPMQSVKTVFTTQTVRAG
jgi:hypothetical protein